MTNIVGPHNSLNTGVQTRRRSSFAHRLARLQGLPQVSMNRRDGLGQINSNDDNTHDFPSEVLMKSKNYITALSMTIAVTSPQPRDGKVPFIRWGSSARAVLH